MEFRMEYPSLQLQEKLPSVFVHIALFGHTFPRHSLISTITTGFISNQMNVVQKETSATLDTPFKIGWNFKTIWKICTFKEPSSLTTCKTK